jgi:uncharacterized protein YjbJ (UPF0337 family)
MANEDIRYRSQEYNSAERDRLEGSMREAGNERLKAEGQGDQIAGAARRKKGSLKDRIKSWIDHL